MTRQRSTAVTLLWVPFTCGGASVARAQEGRRPNEAGFQPNRDYLALPPCESIDSASNNVILTFTDLVLPRQWRARAVF